MVTETAPAIAGLAESLQRLQSDIDSIQHELDQALGVWRGTLLDEKKEFQAQMHRRQSQWEEREAAWQRQRVAYERRIESLAEAFKAQLASDESNALRALNELDDAWQRDKLAWGQEANRRIHELESREAAWLAERGRQGERIQDLEARIAELEAAQTHEDRQIWERERLLWQHSLWQSLDQMNRREALFATERQQADAFIRRVEVQLAELQGVLAALEPGAAQSAALMDSLVSTLEFQTHVLSDLVGISPLPGRA